MILKLKELKIENAEYKGLISDVDKSFKILSYSSDIMEILIQDFLDYS